MIFHDSWASHLVSSRPHTESWPVSEAWFMETWNFLVIAGALAASNPVQMWLASRVPTAGTWSNLEGTAHLWANVRQHHFCFGAKPGSFASAQQDQGKKRIWAPAAAVSSPMSLWRELSNWERSSSLCFEIDAWQRFMLGLGMVAEGRPYSLNSHSKFLQLSPKDLQRVLQASGCWLFLEP
jgi:hypothetical protein